MRNIGSDDEQLDALRAWWGENGKSVIAGIALAVAGLVGWTGYGEWKERTLGNASLAWQELEIAAQSGDEAAFGKADELVSRYGRTPYADLAKLLQARMALDAEDREQARAILEELAQNARQDVVKPVARLRLARLLWAEGEHGAALERLARPAPAAFVTQFEELRGDILRDQGERQAAREAYDRALAAAKPGADTSLLVLKRNDLPAS